MIEWNTRGLCKANDIDFIKSADNEFRIRWFLIF